MGECQQLLVEAFKGSDWVGVLERNDWARNGTIAGFNRWNIQLRNRVYWWVSLYLSMYREFMDIIMAEPLLLMGEPTTQCSNKLGELGHSHKRILGSIPSPITISHYQQLCKEIEDFEGRIILITLGVWGKPLCYYAKKCGKIGIDFGNASWHIGSGNYLPNITGGYGRVGYMEHIKNGAPGPQMFWNEDLTRADKLQGEEY
jgi:hypothetical protein